MIRALWGEGATAGPGLEVGLDRFRGLERISLAGCPCVIVAGTFRARLLGLAWLSDLPVECGLLIPGCSSVHTFGMRFALDLTFLDGDGAVLREETAVPPRRIVRCRGASAVLERRRRVWRPIG